MDPFLECIFSFLFFLLQCPHLIFELLNFLISLVLVFFQLHCQLVELLLPDSIGLSSLLLQQFFHSFLHVSLHRLLKGGKFFSFFLYLTCLLPQQFLAFLLPATLEGDQLLGSFVEALVVGSDSVEDFAPELVEGLKSVGVNELDIFGEGLLQLLHSC